MDKEEAVRAIYHLVNWLVNPNEEFSTVLQYLNELCMEFGTCVKVDEPTRVSVMKAIIEVVMELLSKCDKN
ncbi:MULTISPECIES: hypothetical protein [Vulcanisaeta]|uniref:Uncharacterized protein n=2 Tax=Vulcanisaeta TaxID=164450 RepID=E1QV62_VULDI|nr:MULTISPECIES: hypothetical protein [Vulcanisaeta]ADN51253.1 hypothetical protein Vdis_1881 [Vulcanisaeta distributa DSM 14429]BDR91190.1 hypothetical protein Vsou_02830 [Vulcanisaeta souniana JCM 11219]GGI86511.1 hypothetical protein GCM10007112_24350 [Vulcanisaeta souniana JCM 11219]